MVDLRIARRGIGDARLLAALLLVPREQFVPAALAEFAYADAPLPIEAGQTISQPFIVASMIEAAEVRPHDKVLEVGTGSGYSAAVLGRLARQVHTIERLDELVELSRAQFQRLGCTNIELRSGDGTLGWLAAAPFDAILVAAAGPEVPAPLKSQLALGGRLVMPLDIGGEGDEQRLVKVVRTGAAEYDQQLLGHVRFVPLIGRHGWAGWPVA
jgi:protein-L-isoaspartate(D-aspartate) O-methyltransferase